MQPPHSDKLGLDTGLCATCRHSRVIRSDRGSVFYLCRRAATDSRLAKYPVLPVLTCPGYEVQDEERAANERD